MTFRIAALIMSIFPSKPRRNSKPRLAKLCLEPLEERHLLTFLTTVGGAEGDLADVTNWDPQPAEITAADDLYMNQGAGNMSMDGQLTVKSLNSGAANSLSVGQGADGSVLTLKAGLYVNGPASSSPSLTIDGNYPSNSLLEPGQILVGGDPLSSQSGTLTLDNVNANVTGNILVGPDVGRGTLQLNDANVTAANLIVTA